MCIVESEKTALWASIAYPSKLWLAVGSMLGFSKSKLKALTGRNVELFPDCGKGVIEWKKKMPDFVPYVASIKMNEFVISMNTAENDGKDLMDFALIE